MMWTKAGSAANSSSAGRHFMLAFCPYLDAIDQGIQTDGEYCVPCLHMLLKAGDVMFLIMFDDGVYLSRRPFSS